MLFAFKRLGIPEVVLIEPKVFEDELGHFIAYLVKYDKVDAYIFTEVCQDIASILWYRSLLVGREIENDES